MRRMRITEAHDYDLVGELIDAPPRDLCAVPFTRLSVPISLTA